MEQIRAYQFLVLCLTILLYVCAYMGAEYMAVEEQSQLEELSDIENDSSEEKDIFDWEENHKKNQVAFPDTFYSITTFYWTKKAKLSHNTEIRFPVNEREIPTPPPEKRA